MGWGLAWGGDWNEVGWGDVGTLVLVASGQDKGNVMY